MNLALSLSHTQVALTSITTLGVPIAISLIKASTAPRGPGPTASAAHSRSMPSAGASPAGRADTQRLPDVLLQTPSRVSLCHLDQQLESKDKHAVSCTQASNPSPGGELLRKRGERPSSLGLEASVKGKGLQDEGTEDVCGKQTPAEWSFEGEPGSSDGHGQDNSKASARQDSTGHFPMRDPDSDCLTMLATDVPHPQLAAATDSARLETPAMAILTPGTSPLGTSYAFPTSAAEALAAVIRSRQLPHGNQHSKGWAATTSSSLEVARAVVAEPIIEYVQMTQRKRLSIKVGRHREG